jgi:MFS transporter, ACS family, aldohexuronate transporter
VSRRVLWAVAIVATLTMTVSYIDRATLATLAKSVKSELDIDDTMYGWLSSAFSIAYLFGTPIAGWWIDRAGARRGLVGSLFVWSAIAALHAVVPTFGILFALRIALGLAESPGFPGGAQTMQRVLPPEERSRGFGLLFTGSSIGGMLAPLIAAALYNAAGWRIAFLGTAAVGLVWIPLWLVVTRSSAIRERLDRRELPAKRLSVVETARHPMVLRGLCAIFAVAPVVGFLQSWGALYLDRAFQVQQGDVGHFLWFPPLCLDAGALAFGDLASRRRDRSRPPNALFAAAAILTAVIAMLPFARTPWDGMTIIGIAMAGGGGVYTLVTADLLGRMPVERISLAGGILAGAQSLALIISPPLIGASVDATASFDSAAITLGVWVVPGAIAWLAWRPRVE